MAGSCDTCKHGQAHEVLCALDEACQTEEKINWQPADAPEVADAASKMMSEEQLLVVRIEELEAEVARLKEYLDEQRDLYYKKSQEFGTLAIERMEKHYRVIELQKALDQHEQDRADRFFAAAMQALICADRNEDASFQDIIDYAKKYTHAAMEAATLPREDTEK